MSSYHETYRGHVIASERDLIGHMNIQFYDACISQAMESSFALMGLPPEEVIKTRKGFAAVEQSNRFAAELLAGDIIHVETALLDYTEKSVILNHRLMNSASGALSFETTITALHFDLEARKVIRFTPQTLKLLASLKLTAEAAQ
jgi:acyl-CoA thioester hydrolase